MKKNQKGFGALGVLIILVFIGVIGGGGWLVYHSHKTSKTNGSLKPASTSQNTTASENTAESLSKQYIDPTGLISAKYPATWHLATESSDLSTEHPYVTTSITSPKGTALNLNLDWGGRGGACFAKDTDQPFQAGNQCSSLETLSSEETKINNVYSYITDSINPYKQSFGVSNVVMVTRHYADPSGKSQFTIGLTYSDGAYPVVTDKPVMGFVTSDDWFDIYDVNKKDHGEVHAYASFGDQAGLDTRDAKTVKAILQSVLVNLPK